MTYGTKPFGLRDIKLTDSTGVTQVDLPAAMTLTLTPRVKSGELAGDDTIASVYAAIEALEGKLESGGIDLSAYALITGSTLSTSGTTPTRVRSLTLTGGMCLPYFKVYGKSVSDDCTSDIHAKLWKVKATKPPEGELKNGEFYVTKCEVLAVPDASGNIITWVQNETAADLPAS